MARPASPLGPPIEVVEPDPAVADLLGVLRRHLGMDLAWLGRVEGDLLVLQVVNGDAAGFGLAPGSTIRREAALYTQVLAHDQPVIVPDTHRDPRTAAAGTVRALGIGAYAATPVYDNDNDIYGILGCLAHQPHPQLREREGRFLSLLAAFLSDAVIDLHRVWETRSRVSRVINDLIDAGGPQIVFQPVVDLTEGRVVGVEALSRFPGSTDDPEGWYAVASSVGLGTDLELVAIRRALTVLSELPRPVTLAVNASPATITSGLIGLLASFPACERLIVEITEHEYFSADPVVMRGVHALRALGVQIAVDDIGTGYAGLEQLIHLRPEIVKLDYLITHGMDHDPARRAVAAAIVDVTAEIGGCVIAEGIENAAELRVAIDVGVDFGQGYLLGAPARSARAACAPAVALADRRG
ncbi:sensor domain-containing phosphodiesterase [Parafrankia discariae]|uniref:sensor domain-containing phosphodiesterase n=1 Tax=Parafrankia discariae TaxID=365528 RepID=UPI000376356F|nr:EAL domain-containing protein [Parafrankia discariae]